MFRCHYDKYVFNLGEAGAWQVERGRGGEDDYEKASGRCCDEVSRMLHKWYLSKKRPLNSVVLKIGLLNHDMNYFKANRVHYCQCGGTYENRIESTNVG